MDYKIIQRFTFANLEPAVKEAMEEGWQPLGAPLPVTNQSGWYAQAMIKRAAPAAPSVKTGKKGPQ